MKKRIVITGSTGLIGSYLVEELKDRYELILLTRNPDKHVSSDSVKYVYWDGITAINEVLEGSYGVINLIGENIGSKNWSQDQKKRILNSRVDAAQAISKSIELCNLKPKIWIQGSATGFYGQSSNVIFDESSPEGVDSFLAHVCAEWEKPIRELKDENIRKIIIRTGVVLAKNSDLWKQLNQSFQFGVAAIVGNGKQTLPWIHIEDEVNAISYLLKNEALSGTYNLVVPTKTSMSEVIDAIKTKKRSFITLCIPRWFLSLIFGKEKTNELVLTDQIVVPKNLLDGNFEFKYSSILQTVDKLLD